MSDSSSPLGRVLRYDKAQERRAAIVRRLRATGFVSVADLASELAVSDMTIRRDLRGLSDDGVVRVVRGGVSLPHATLRTTKFVSRARAHAAAKRSIAMLAAALVSEHDVVAIDAGTTAYNVATALPSLFDGTVITHSVPVVQHMLGIPTARLVGLGGELYTPSQAFVGPSTVEQARHLRSRIFFLGAAAVDERGVYVESDIECATKLALIQSADHVVLVVDAAKFTVAAPVLLCGLDQLTTVVTDAVPPTAVRRQLRADAVEVLLAPSQPSRATPNR
jgi:DeoR family fructose operon transcriptional repressor